MAAALKRTNFWPIIIVMMFIETNNKEWKYFINHSVYTTGINYYPFEIWRIIVPYMI